MSRRTRTLTDIGDSSLEGASCLYDPELHDGPADGVETPEQRAAREDVAKDVCAMCPVLAACKRYTAQARPVSGVWAARTAADRTAPAAPGLVLAERNLLIGGIPDSGKTFATRYAAALAALDDKQLAAVNGKEVA